MSVTHWLRRIVRLLRNRDGGARANTGWFQQAGRQIDARGLFVGCPLHVFEHTARDLFCVALVEGLKRDSRVLEVGAGCLRTGYWFIRFLDAGKYAGIEPHAAMLDAGRNLILGKLEQEKQPLFDTNDTFDFGAFERSFDVVVAFSIWSHASKQQISTMLDQFSIHGAPAAKLITSYLPPGPDLPDYLGSEWVGRSHKSRAPGLVGHDPDWMEQAASARGLILRHFDLFTTLNQNWLVFQKPSA